MKGMGVPKLDFCLQDKKYKFPIELQFSRFYERKKFLAESLRKIITLQKFQYFHYFSRYPKHYLKIRIRLKKFAVICSDLYNILHTQENFEAGTHI